MIKSGKTTVWRWIGRNLLAGMLRTKFQAIYLGIPGGLDNLHRKSVLLCANHSCRWDGASMMYLTEVCLGLDGYLMMASTVMKKYPILRKFGCFEVDVADPFRANTSIDYAAQLVKDQIGRGLIIFPQGEYARGLVRPLRFRQGIAQVARKTPESVILPVGLYYDFFIAQSPELFISVGQPLQCSDAICTTRELTDLIEQAVTRELDSLQAMVAENRIDMFQVVMRGRDNLQFWLLKKFDPQWEYRAMPPPPKKTGI